MVLLDVLRSDDPDIFALFAPLSIEIKETLLLALPISAARVHFSIFFFVVVVAERKTTKNTNRIASHSIAKLQMKRKIHNDDDQKDVISEVSDEEISEPAEPHMQPKQKKQRILHTDNQPSLDTAATNANNNNIQECPYLDTINRKLLDFDFEKICSVTLRSSNVYACLVCGRYFQGRSVNSPAYSHSINAEHHVFMNLQNGKVCLQKLGML